MPNYDMRIQRDIPIACVIVHNLITRYQNGDHWLHYYDKDCHPFRELAFEHAQASPRSRDPMDESLIGPQDDEATSDNEDPYVPLYQSMDAPQTMNEICEEMTDEMWARYQVQPWYRNR